MIYTYGDIIIVHLQQNRVAVSANRGPEGEPKTKIKINQSKNVAKRLSGPTGGPRSRKPANRMIVLLIEPPSLVFRP